MLLDQDIAHGAHDGVGGQTRESVRAAAVGADDQVRDSEGLAAILNVRNGPSDAPLYTEFDGVTVGQDTVLVAYTWNGDATKWYTMFNIGSSFDVATEIDGTLMERANNYWINYAGPKELAINIGGTILSNMRYRSLDFEWNSINLEVNVVPLGCLTAHLMGRIGSNIDYANEREATSFRLNPAVEYKVGKHLSLTFDHAFERLDVEDGRLYAANISQAWIVYQFSKRMFVRSIFQYVNYARNADLYLAEVPERDEHFFSQLR